ncbi:chemotaxis protein CheB [Asticcacaulis solisilvae]|uniref:chemotaxis protein CheB n=1 Tax=Asticcacaulis solisilvae TaxID=1217274 RepID=UPI003FD80CE7
MVGIGASAGGLDAASKLLDALPSDTGMAFILVQHLDPTHDSLMVDLLSIHTRMTVAQAAEGMRIAADHIYVIPPGAYLSVSNGALHVSTPRERHGARLPFDFMLASLAEAYGPNAVCVVLSGTGADGAVGIGAIKSGGGLAIAQTPEEAAYGGMPKSAIATGLVDLVLPLAGISEALGRHLARTAGNDKSLSRPQVTKAGCLPDIVTLLRNKTAHDYTLYKPGTLQRRIERRMALAAIKPDNMAGYLDLLRGDDGELEQLAKDLLIHITGFFRDPKVFKLLADKIVPDLVDGHPSDQSLRIWVAGCSTGEEAYSLAIVFREALTKAGRSNKLQVFASDVDADAIASARDGLYPAAIETDVSAERLARFFVREDSNYRVTPELRSTVVFTVQDVLTDPPFSRIDLVSCRNLLIYLGAEAQAKVISLFHFALRQGGLMLLGASETPGLVDGRFQIVSKSERLYRQIGRSRPGDFGFSTTVWEGLRPQGRQGQPPTPSRQAALAEFCRQWALETYAPAVVLLNSKNECLFKLGPISRYLSVPEGHPTTDVLTLAPQGLRTKLRSAIQRARQTLEAGPGAAATRIVVSSNHVDMVGDKAVTQIEVQSVMKDGEMFFLLGFVDVAMPDAGIGRSVSGHELTRVKELEQELISTRIELQGAIHNLEMAGEEQKAINEEALSVNEEYQSTNEELLTSKEELQSLNEELTALNSQLQETLDRQRTTASDLQNVLYSTDVATLFLDTEFNIRFFTPATKSLFNIIPGDVGRPLTDLSSLAADGTLLDDARRVLKDSTPVEREVEMKDGVWFIRRILPYRGHDQRVEGVVITFTDITERKIAARALDLARQQAEAANMAKTRFLAAASHDLRQPLQSLALLQGMLARMAEGEGAAQLVARLDETLESMAGMLNTLLDINQFEAGIIRPFRKRFVVNDVLMRLKDDFTYHADAKHLVLKVVPCTLAIDTDPALLEQILRNLLSNALKYTRAGRVLLGCRRFGDVLRVEVWDTGIGIPKKDVAAIFDEYYQVDNDARERSLGLGLGLSIVQRLGQLLDHRISVRSQFGKGSVFSIEIGMMRDDAGADEAIARIPHSAKVARDVAERRGRILVIEDDPEFRDLLETFLRGEGHEVMAVGDGVAAVDAVARGAFYPDLVMADYNLPKGLTGVQASVEVRRLLKTEIPVSILTGDISAATRNDISGQNCLQLNKPVRFGDLVDMIQTLLPHDPGASKASPFDTPSLVATDVKPLIYVVDDDVRIRDAMRLVFEKQDMTVETFADGETFLAGYRSSSEACLLLDAYLPGMSGLDLLARLRHDGDMLPVLMMTGDSDVATAVQAMRAGASDFLEKPIIHNDLMASIRRAWDQGRDSRKSQAWHQAAAGHLAGLTGRQRQILDLVLDGHPNKNIAADLGISQRTVENHRATIMTKTGAKSLPALARLALAAAERTLDE